MTELLMICAGTSCAWLAIYKVATLRADYIRKKEKQQLRNK